MEPDPNNTLRVFVLRPSIPFTTTCVSVVVEPVASARPKFQTMADSQAFRVTLGGAMTLLCPAQGFPVPSYRLQLQSLIEVQNALRYPFPASNSLSFFVIFYLNFSLEPASSSKPKFPSVNDIGVRVNKDSSFTMLCPAQAYPVATFRASRFSQTKVFDNRQESDFRYIRGPWCDSTMPCPGVSCPFLQVKPVGLARPKFSSIHKSLTFDTYEGRGVTLQCPAQAYPVPFFKTRWLSKTKIFINTQKSDFRYIRGPWCDSAMPCSGVSCPFLQVKPVSSTKPKLTSLDVKSTNPNIYMYASTTLLCPVQGFPVPAFRTYGKYETKILRGFLALHRDIPCPHLEPVTSAKPKFLNADIKVLMPTSMSTSVSLTCPAQGFPVPISRTKPKFTNDDIKVVKPTIRSSAVALTCPGQGFPVPITRAKCQH
ncbi:hypothetical protein KQX54_011180 [Cotesia glomerata]|uniref:Ig-like domain-containing protein n=1 Tax=Cotesia glomerata TaxID=32391 RepID=A0AAV7J469_COTGL|nr:hypothetical protein KQX54_011180 [Cotesia glomerata]